MNCYDYDFFLRKRKEEPRTAGPGQQQLLNQWEAAVAGYVCVGRAAHASPQATRMSLVTPENMTVTLKTCDEAANSV